MSKFRSIVLINSEIENSTLQGKVFVDIENQICNKRDSPYFFLGILRSESVHRSTRFDIVSACLRT